MPSKPVDPANDNGEAYLADKVNSNGLTAETLVQVGPDVRGAAYRIAGSPWSRMVLIRGKIQPVSIPKPFNSIAEPFRSNALSTSGGTRMQGNDNRGKTYTYPSFPSASSDPQPPTARLAWLLESGPMIATQTPV